MESCAIYAGTFDPLTLGHIDLVERTARIFEVVILAVAKSPPKDTLFTVEERVALTRKVTSEIANVEVDTFGGLLIDYARARGARVLVRGIRAYSDFEYEFRMALTNRKLAPEIETLFMMPKESQSYVNSSMVREIAELGGDVSGFVSPDVAEALHRKYSEHGG